MTLDPGSGGGVKEVTDAAAALRVGE